MKLLGNVAAIIGRPHVKAGLNSEGGFGAWVCLVSPQLVEPNLRAGGRICSNAAQKDVSRMGRRVVASFDEISPACPLTSSRMGISSREFPMQQDKASTTISSSKTRLATYRGFVVQARNLSFREAAGFHAQCRSIITIHPIDRLLQIINTGREKQKYCTPREYLFS